MNRHTAPRSTTLKTHPATGRALGAFVATAIVVVAASLSPPAMAMPGGHGGMQHAGMHGGGMHGGGMMAARRWPSACSTASTPPPSSACRSAS